MPASVEEIRKSVVRAIEEFNRSEDRQVPPASETVLLGAGAAVDSLGLVRLILTVERRLEDDFSAVFSLTDEKAMSQRNSPFRTVGTLIDYISAGLSQRP